MSTVSSVFSPSLYQAYSVMSQNSTAQALVASGAALQSGSLTDTNPQVSSGEALAEESQSTSTKPAPINAQADADYDHLVNDVRAGDLSDAQAALAKLQIDLKAGHGGHHHGGAPPPTTVTTDSLSSADDTGSSGIYVNVTV
jgi:hypothetical protein